MSTACVTGRFQPIHVEHLRLMRDIVAAGESLVIGVTNAHGLGAAAPESTHRHVAAANPLTFAQRATLIAAALGDIPHRVVAFDLDDPEGWAAVVPLDVTQVVGVKSDWERAKLRRFAAAGYPTRAVAVHDADCCSTAVRAALAAGSPAWKALVPRATVRLLEEMLR